LNLLPDGLVANQQPPTAIVAPIVKIDIVARMRRHAAPVRG
jgi:hypothetical protein